jgi:hypothetical protein
MSSASKDGDYFWWLVRGIPFFKKEISLSGLGRTDKQNIKKTEIELKAKKKAEESDRLKSAF